MTFPFQFNSETVLRQDFSQIQRTSLPTNRGTIVLLIFWALHTYSQQPNNIGRNATRVKMFHVSLQSSTILQQAVRAMEWLTHLLADSAAWRAESNALS